MTETPTPEVLAGSDLPEHPLAALVHDLVPLVRAYNSHGPRSGVRSNVDATVVLLHRMGLLSTETEPELILRALGRVETCDWGGCSREAVALRWSAEHALYLSVCATCAVEVAA